MHADYVSRHQQRKYQNCSMLQELQSPTKTVAQTPLNVIIEKSFNNDF